MEPDLYCLQGFCLVDNSLSGQKVSPYLQSVAIYKYLQEGSGGVGMYSRVNFLNVPLNKLVFTKDFRRLLKNFKNEKLLKKYRFSN